MSLLPPYEAIASRNLQYSSTDENRLERSKGDTAAAADALARAAVNA
jgi:hypothetical protein